MEKVIFSNKGGMGLILEGNEKESDYFLNKPILINGITTNPGEFTDLFGLFTEPLKYVGVLKNDKNCMAFYLGEDGDLFETKKYYCCFFWINENRLANKYAENTVRDLNWIDNKWK
jgi:hypothetical protein